MEQRIRPHEIKVDGRTHQYLKTIACSMSYKMQNETDIILNGWKRSGITEIIQYNVKLYQMIVFFEGFLTQ